MRELSLMERFARLPADRRTGLLTEVDVSRRLGLMRHWRWTARPAQLAPRGDWSLWLILAGRGFGKTRAGAEWVAAQARRHPGARIALVAQTAKDGLGVMIEGESGLLLVGSERFRPVWQAGRRTLLWPNGSRATLFSAMEPDQLRGPQFHFAWCDELGAWPNAKQTLDMLRMGLRLGNHPRIVATTTPRPIPLLRTLMAAPGTVVTRGTTFDNRAHLPAQYLADVTQNYGGTSLGRQELMGELLEAREGALWSLDGLDRCREAAVPPLVRVVVGVDPPAGPGGCGIVVAGLDADGVAHVVADASVSAVSPDLWAAAVAAAYRRFEADRVVAEVNNGGEMVVSTLKAACQELPVKQVRASRGKAARAEPVAALYGAGRVRHAGSFPLLEDEMCGLIQGGGYVGPGQSPDRADALVWALTELLLARPGAGPGVRMLAD
ncbi:MAG: ATP-binding protein [Sphingomonas sp.]|nr:MAG: ATP-binding protein [Sphingomonas sp.]